MKKVHNCGIFCCNSQAHERTDDSSSGDLVNTIAAVAEICSILPLDSSKITRSFISPV